MAGKKMFLKKERTRPIVPSLQFIDLYSARCVMIIFSQVSACKNSFNNAFRNCYGKSGYAS